MNKIHVAATELLQLLKQKTNKKLSGIFGEATGATAQKPLSDFVHSEPEVK